MGLGDYKLFHGIISLGFRTSQTLSSSSFFLRASAACHPPNGRQRRCFQRQEHLAPGLYRLKPSTRSSGARWHQNNLFSVGKALHAPFSRLQSNPPHRRHPTTGQDFVCLPCYIKYSSISCNKLSPCQLCSSCQVSKHKSLLPSRLLLLT